MLRLLTAGDSHGEALIGILDGVPAGLELSIAGINAQLRRRQGGYGRGARMLLERDEIEIVGGLWKGRTSGAPIGLSLRNRAKFPGGARLASVPRPGHADYAGAVKYGHFDDISPVAERASARETAIRVAAGAVMLQFLERFGINTLGHVVGLGPRRARCANLAAKELRRRRDNSAFYCADQRAEREFRELTDCARRSGETLGGAVEVLAFGLPPGLGSYAQFDRRLDSRLAQHLLSIPSCRAMEIGDGLGQAEAIGGQAQDPIVRIGRKIGRSRNRAGGIEGGMSNGETLVVRAYVKPLSTLRRSLPSVDLKTGETQDAPYVRSDVTVAPAVSVIAEALVAYVLGEAFLERFGGDTLAAVECGYKAWKREFSGRVRRWKFRDSR